MARTVRINQCLVLLVVVALATCVTAHPDDPDPSKLLAVEDLVAHCSQHFAAAYVEGIMSGPYRDRRQLLSPFGHSHHKGDASSSTPISTSSQPCEHVRQRNFLSPDITTAYEDQNDERCTSPFLSDYTDPPHMGMGDVSPYVPNFADGMLYGTGEFDFSGDSTASTMTTTTQVDTNPSIGYQWSSPPYPSSFPPGAPVPEISTMDQSTQSQMQGYVPGGIWPTMPDPEMADYRPAPPRPRPRINTKFLQPHTPSSQDGSPLSASSASSSKSLDRGRRSKGELTNGVHEHKCPTCNAGFHKRGDLNHHCKTTHTPKEERVHACRRCQQRFVYPKDLRRHELKHLSHRELQCPVEGCPRDFHRKDHLKRHMTNCHSDLNGRETPNSSS